MEETARQVVDDLTSRGALSGAASLLMLVGILVGWWIWTRRIALDRRAARVRILVTGSRGKSSTVRLLHSTLLRAGFLPYGKVTGTTAAELGVDGSEIPTHRLGAPSILETLSTMRRAFSADPPANSLVIECMAVSPDLIGILSGQMVDPDIVLMTNIQLDHLEEEGGSVSEIAESLARAIRPGSLVITTESEPEALDVIERHAREKEATLLVTSETDVSDEILERVPWAHPQNVALTFAVTSALEIADEVAVAGMRKASTEPGEREVWKRSLGGMDATYADLGAINDPESLKSALESFDWPSRPDTPRVAIVSGRWDRPLRALEFSGFLGPEAFDGMLIAGGPVHPIKRSLVEGGWEAERVLIASRLDGVVPIWRRQLERLVRRIDPDASEVMVVSLENEHDALAETARAFFRNGQRVDGGTDREVEVEH